MLKQEITHIARKCSNYKTRHRRNTFQILLDSISKLVQAGEDVLEWWFLVSVRMVLRANVVVDGSFKRAPGNKHGLSY